MNTNLTILRTYRKRKTLLRLSPEQHYTKYLGLIHSFIKKNRWRNSYQELLSTANEAYVHALHSYDPTKGEFSTHLYHILHGAFYTKKTAHLVPYTDQHSKTYDPFCDIVLKNTIENLSTEAQEVIDIALNTPLELIELARDLYGNCHITAKNIIKYLRLRHNWTYQHISQIIHEIKEALS